MAFDGTNIWITNGGSGKITKLRASDGAILGAFDTGTGPVTITFDGDYIWVANYLSNTVMKMKDNDPHLMLKRNE